MKIINEKFLEKAKISVTLRDGVEYLGMDLIHPQKADNVVCFWDNKDNYVRIFPLDLVKEVAIYEE